MKKVLIYRSQLLAYSETFVRDQTLALKRWAPVLVGLERLEGGLPLEGLDSRLLDVQYKLWPKRLELYRTLEIAPPGVVGQMKQLGCSLVHVHFGNDAASMWPAFRRLQVPVLVTLHGFDITISESWWAAGHAGRSGKKYPERLRALSAFTRVQFIAVSEAIRQRAIERGLPATRIHTRYIGIDLAKFASAGDDVSRRAPSILFIGRLVEKKGASFLLKALSLVNERMPGASLRIIGDGPLRGALEREAAELRLPVRFLGRLPPEAVKAELDRCRVLCLPSIAAENGDAEGLPIVIMEAQACGVPVVTSAHGGATEGIRPDETGFAFPERNVEAMADALLRVLTDDVLSGAMSVKAVGHAADRFDIVKCTASLESLYDDVSHEAFTCSNDHAA